ncbi:MAG: biotin--[acetyl-CoA-carboxylase] ligase, partial [Rhodobacteraceae bacterium]|nr:biotin--[acetyl-CoA-carboxylase] ligase [Paracoccaceae bacterium]
MSNNFPIGYDRRILASVDSTNAEAVRIAKTVSGPTWILGLRQTQGRGRRGRAWMDPEGNFA